MVNLAIKPWRNGHCKSNPSSLQRACNGLLNVNATERESLHTAREASKARICVSGFLWGADG